MTAAGSGRVRGGWPGRLALVVLAPVAWLLLLNVNTGQLLPSLDESYVAVMTHYLAERVHFGADVTFNYGPLAPLGLQLFDGRTYGMLFAGELFLKAAIVFLVGRLAWDTRGWRRWLLPLAILAVPANWQVLFFFAAAGAVGSWPGGRVWTGG